MPSDVISLRPALRVRRALGRLRRSPAVEQATGLIALHHRRAHQRLCARFVRGVWLHTQDYLNSVPAGGTFHPDVDTGHPTVVGPPTFVPDPPEEPFPAGIAIRRHPRGVADLLQPWIVGPSGAVIGRDRRLLWDLSYEWPGRPHSHPSYELTDLEAVELPGTTVALTAMGADKNYFHLLLNALGRLAYLERFAPAIEPDRYLISGQVTPFVLEALALFGVRADRVVGTAAYPAILAERLIAPPLVHHPFVVPADVCRFLRTKVLAQLSRQTHRRRRLFIDRADAAVRRIVNLDELAPVFAEYGIECVRLAGRSLAAQARLFRSAELVVANHGAGLSNLLFCAPQTRVLQVLAPGMMEREYRTLCQHLDLRHDYVVAAFASKADVSRPRKDRDLILSPARLHQVLAQEGWAHR